MIVFRHDISALLKKIGLNLLQIFSWNTQRIKSSKNSPKHFQVDFHLQNCWIRNFHTLMSFVITALLIQLLDFVGNVLSVMIMIYVMNVTMNEITITTQLTTSSKSLVLTNQLKEIHKKFFHYPLLVKQKTVCSLTTFNVITFSYLKREPPHSPQQPARFFNIFIRWMDNWLTSELLILSHPQFQPYSVTYNGFFSEFERQFPFQILAFKVMWCFFFSSVLVFFISFLFISVD